MFELADYLVGIYKVEDCTRSLTIQNYDKQNLLKIGEDDGEKENFYQNSFNISSSSVPKPSQASLIQAINTTVPTNANVSASMDISMGDSNAAVVNNSINSSISQNA